MASPTPRRVPASRPGFPHREPPRREPLRPHPPASFEVVDPVWLLKAAAIAIAAAVLCAYLTLCLLVYQGQWQLVLHPDATRGISTTLPIQTMRFGAAETGQPRLSGLWLPTPDSGPSTPTILFLPDGSGRLADDLSTLAQLHQLPLNIFAFDYRGFGSSDLTPHPTEVRMTQDAEAALNFLVDTRHFDPHTIVPYGAGLGASLAAALCLRHPELPALIVESPVPNTFQLAHADARASFVPLRLFFHERFEIAPVLITLKTPKLLLTAGPSHVVQKPQHPLVTPQDNARAIDALFRQAASPSFIAHLLAGSSPAGNAAYRETILRFLNEYLPGSSSLPPPSLTPSSTESPARQGPAR